MERFDQPVLEIVNFEEDVIASSSCGSICDWHQGCEGVECPDYCTWECEVK